MRLRLLVIWSVLIAVAAIAIIIVVRLAPQTTSIQATDSNQAGCLHHDNGGCLVMPAVTGVDLDNQPLAFPDAFTHRYNLIVMPFNRDQQVLALTWLPLFQQLAARYADVSYYSIAALPDLNAGIRLLVMTGMNAGMHEPDIRQKTALLFLDDQQAFLDALAIPTTEQTRILILDQSGVVYWQGSGSYTVELGQVLENALTRIVD